MSVTKKATSRKEPDEKVPDERVPPGTKKKSARKSTETVASSLQHKSPAKTTKPTSKRKRVEPSLNVPPATLEPTTSPRPSSRPLHKFTGYELPLDKESLRQSVSAHIEYTQGKDAFEASPLDYYFATARAVRDRLLDRWNKTQETYDKNDTRRVYYLSAEYLLGRSLEASLLSLGIHQPMQDALASLGLELSHVAEAEPDAGLGRNGSGRLGACMLESMATTGIAAHGYGIRYDYGAFEQRIVEGRAILRADNWLRYGSPWELMRPERRFLVGFGGGVKAQIDGSGKQVFKWIAAEQVWAMACDYLVPGFGNDVVNTLRLWSARGTKDFKLECDSHEDYLAAIEQKYRSEDLSRMPYPEGESEHAQALRLRQLYFYVSATLQDAIARHLERHSTLTTLPEQAIFQLSGPGPALAVPELMRLLIDDYGFSWDEAWSMTQRSLAYSHLTALPEAEVHIPVALLEQTLPRQLQILYEINRRFIDEVRSRFPGDSARVARMSLFSEVPSKRLRLSHLCLVGCGVTSGVSELQGRILRDSLFRDFAEIWPQRFTHVTSGVTVRRWLLKSNPQLSELITSEIGEKWLTDPHQLRRLSPKTQDPTFREAFRRVKQARKQLLADVLTKAHGLVLDPTSLLTVQVQNIEASRRQLLNVLHIVTLYLSYRATGAPPGTPKRTFLFAGRAAPGDGWAKDLVELIVALGKTIESEPRVRDLLQVVFVPNYNVSLAELIIPAADVSEQLSLAGTQASTTGSLKLMLNGAVTVGTPDGSNLEMAEAVGLDSIFLFGLTAPEVEGLRYRVYSPQKIYFLNAEIRASVDAIGRGVFSPTDPGRFSGLVQSLLAEDRFLVLADFVTYRNCHRNVLSAFGDRDGFSKRSIMNICNFGRFSSDEMVRGYARDIWKVPA